MKFAATFGQKYRHEPHPVLAHVDVDGFILIYAEDEDEARTMLHIAVGPAYAFIYPYETDEEQFNVDRYQTNGSFMVLMGPDSISEAAREEKAS